MPLEQDKGLKAFSSLKNMVKEKELNRKGVFGLSGQVVGYLVVIIMIGVVATILTSLQTANTTNYAQTNNNRSHTFTSGVATLDGASLNGFSGLSIISINNFTNNTIGSNNYNVNGTGGLTGSLGVVTLKAGATGAGAQGTSPILNVSYSYSAYVLNGAYNTTVDGLTGTNNFSGQMPLLATILVFAAIIGAVVFLANAFRQRS